MPPRDPLERRAYDRSYIAANRDAVNARRRRYAASHRDQQRESGDRSRTKRRKSARDHARQYYYANHAMLRERASICIKAHREANNAHNRRRRARKLNAPGSGVSPGQWREIVHAFGARCAYCARVIALTQDHVEPLSRGGLHEPTNVVPCCTPCNSSKNARPLLLWLATSPLAMRAS